MTLELRPLGVKCNIQCQYCYQTPQRDANNIAHTYDLEKMKATAVDLGGKFTLFGGEPLLLPEEDLEDLWAWGYERNEQNGIQTNGSLINDTHIRMFKQYKVHVGMSIDGPGELNDARWAGTLKKTREMTAKSEAAIERLCEEGIPPSLIVTLHRGNANAINLPLLHDWFRHLVALGITYARLHILETESPLIRQKYGLTDEENIAAFTSFLALEQELPQLQLDVFDDMRELLLGQDDSVTCVWNACDPYTTRAVQGIEGDGQRTNCGRTNKDGIDFVKADQEGFERYLALYHTPQAYGGCKDCRFFLMCKGECPGTAIDGDWRNRTQDCRVWYTLYEQLEAQLTDQGKDVVTQYPARLELESIFLDAWANGRYTNIASAIKQWERQTEQAANSSGTNGHGDYTDHGDIPHRDHTDYDHKI